MNKKIKIVILSILLIIIGGIIIKNLNYKTNSIVGKDKNSNDNFTEEERTLKEQKIFGEKRGHLLRKLHELEEKDLHTYAEGINVVITEEEMQYMIQSYMLKGAEEDVARKKAFDFWTSKKASFHVAESAGYLVTDEEISAAIQNYKDMIVEFEKGKGEKSPMTLEIEGYGSEEEYYKSLAETYRVDMTIGKHEAALMKMKAEALNVDSDDWDFRDSWIKEYKKLVEEWVSKEKIKVVK